jgi:cold shock CspA family protein
VIKRFVHEPTGYGFVIVPTLDREIFVHAIDLVGRARFDPLEPGTVVEINHVRRERDGKLRALGVRLLNDDGRQRTFAPEGPVWRA